MSTIKEKLLNQAETQAERELIARWLSEERDELCARRRAWQDFHAKGNWARVHFNW